MRTKRTFLNAVFSVASLFLTSVLSLLLTRTVLVHLGSDYNGLNGTITQFLSILMLFESGFTIAALVKLYQPYGERDFAKISSILSKAARSLRRIGVLMLGFGILGAAVYAFFIKTSVEYWVIVAMFVCSIATTAFDFFYTYKFRLMLQVSQNEYIFNVVKIFQYLVMYGGMILIVQTTKNIVLARMFFLVSNMLGGVAIGIICRRMFPQASYHAPCEDVKIEGTRDLFVSRMVGVLYGSLTVFYMSVFVGTSTTSVYVIYNSVISIINSLVNTATSAPQNALGQIINSERERLRATMREYEFTTIALASVLFPTTLVLIVPFVRFYTSGVTDVNYVDPTLAVILVLTYLVQIIHIPSGRCIELSGSFRVMRNIQMITFITLAVFSAIGGFFFGLLGLLLAKLFTNVILAGIEIWYAHQRIVEGALRDFLLILLPYLLLMSVATFAEFFLLYQVQMNLFSFFGFGLLTVLVNAALVMGFARLFYKDLFYKLISRAKQLFAHKKKQSAN